MSITININKTTPSTTIKNGEENGEENEEENEIKRTTISNIIKM